MEDRELLQKYTEGQSEEAFAELVSRHVNLVYSTAYRVVGDPQWAQDVAQSVFIKLAQKAGTVRQGNALPGWLYRATCSTAANAIRSESRRRHRETEAMNRAQLDANPQDSWEAIAPLLEEGMRKLDQTEQDAIVLRFFEGKNLREAGATLGLTENAMQKRVCQAVERLRDFFAKRGITTSADALSVVLTANAIQAAPVGLAVTISTAAALGGTTIATTVTATATKAIAMTTLQKSIIGVTLAAAVGTGIYEARQAAKLREQNQALQQQQAPLTGQIQQLILEKDDMSRELAAIKTKRLVLESAVSKSADVKGKSSLAEIEAKIRELGGAAFRFGDRRRHAEWQKFAASIDPADIPQTLALLDRVGSKHVRDTFRNVLLARWAEADPKAAADYAGTMPAGPERNGLISNVAEEWAQTDLNSAVAWAKQLPDVRSREDALWNIVPHWAQTDPEGALAYAQSLTPGHAQNRILERIAAELASTDPTKAMELANRLPVGSAQDTFIGGMAEGMAQNSPQEAAHFVSKLPVGEAQTLAALRVAVSWVTTDPQAAAAWVSAFPAGETRDKVLKNVVWHWADSDPPAAGKWLATLPADQSQATIQRYISQVSSPYPELAAPWVETIINPKQRNSTIEDIARRWLTTDPTAAQAWLAKSSLPDDRKQLLLK